MTDVSLFPQLGSIEAACRAIGGDKPINRSTYYRGVKAGRFPPPVRVGANVSRVDLQKLAEVLRAAVNKAS
jgi:hypothetical protein